ncbi:hypothetical protein WAI453_001701 [Rhynchosporium graminicola]|uniref:Uncharacterized protein n=1 Tax=Rhynchosporium graminicola TaxID=2792576 RepID=A0A1E1LP92_9HELO|nr:uncharacterized protein RCO7_09038 [Rhynchosporium commune]
MHFSSSLALTAALLASNVGAQFCDSAIKLCYDPPYELPQNVTVEDVQAVATYLRNYGLETKEGRQYTMTAEAAPACAEWTLYNSGTVIALAQHINTTADSSVLYADIANTIDGGASPTQEQREASLMGCRTSGGAVGVKYDAANPAYHTAAYLAKGYTPGGISIKIVSSQ